MGKRGWLTMRNVPVNHKKPVGNSYYQILIGFFEQNRLCPSCKGLGWKYPKGKLEVESETAVKYGGLEDLEGLAQNTHVRKTDIIRDILEMKLWGKEVCCSCGGKKFVTNGQFNELKHLRKLKRAQRGKTRKGR